MPLRLLRCTAASGPCPSLPAGLLRPGLPCSLAFFPPAAVDEKQRFTVYWLECSLEAGAPLPPNRGAPLYQPLPYPLPLPGMTDVV